jgi:L-fucose isomerase-like protein
MANPSEIVADDGRGRGRLLLAHCTVPGSLLASYGVRSHFESGRGVAVAGTFAPGPVTLARIGGKGLDEVWVAEGRLESSPSNEGLCRTQAAISLDSGDIERFLASPLGNHIVVGFGACAASARRYLALEHLREI